ncbi:LacI family DNA-binding transcriptional regulator [Conexibacter woesei]|uniref:Transcriptional regulator, LacI family n=1 Tax=Conexibacter woesei (strain DSM 14684 / CCUG 47730 / CIP 108061 / JCM 11494 / NBRC 100937 / ID131577) TaxID=469383 RepID=D3F6H9_CONWI|nr:LacI family DNA-binding transcriptional regulator [Conexibacter woesei]ADB50746.1 transcriptional regulator, LacI family [Conexibacter woesei DSM 14684]
MSSPAGRARTTIRDVAAAVGVSAKTVSLAINGKDGVDPATRAQVLAEAARLDYRASRSARALRAGRSNTLALLMPMFGIDETEMLSLSYYMLLASAAAGTAFGRDHALLLTPSVERTALLRQLDVDGVVICDPAERDPRIDLFDDLGVEVVTIERDPGRPEQRWYVASDNRGDTLRMLDHLHDAGARRIALLAAICDWGWMVDSVDAYCDWCAEHAAEPLVARASFSDLVGSAKARARELLTLPDRPDAIVVLAEGHAGAVVQAARELGLEVPRDVLLVSGIDSPETRYGEPAITALDLHSDRRGRAAIELLLARLAGDEEPQAPRTVPADLVVRTSSVPPLRPRRTTRRRRSQAPS